MSECCNHNCNEGRTCPERTRRQQEAEARHQTERAIAADPVGVEAALPIQYAEPEPAPRLSGEAKVLIVAVCLFWLAILALSIADPRDLSTLWPRLVALASF